MNQPNYYNTDEMENERSNENNEKTLGTDTESTSTSGSNGRTNTFENLENPEQEILSEPMCLGKCTIKEIINEIMDCTVVRKPPSTSKSPEDNTENGSNEKPSSRFASSHSQATICTMKDIIGRILDYTVCPSSSNQSCLNTNIMKGNFSLSSEAEEFGKCLQRRELQSELGALQRDYQILRTVNTNTIKSESAMPVVKELQPPKSPSLKSMGHLLPTYSTVLKLGPHLPPPKLIKPIESSASFIPRIPPPSYAEVEGIWDDLQSMISSESVIFGPDPIYMVCPTCRVVVVTHTDQECSSLTHFAALIMCVCFCWPCCLLPYCFRSCSYTYHSCPNCHHYFGMHTPF